MAKTGPNFACQFVYTCRKLPCTYFLPFLLRIPEIKYVETLFEARPKGASNKRIFIYLRAALQVNCRFYWLYGLGLIDFLAGIVTYAFGAQSSNKFRASSLLVISTDVQRLFEEYLRPPGRRFGIIKPLILDESPACLKEPRCVFVLRSWFKSAVNLDIVPLKNKWARR